MNSKSLFGSSFIYVALQFIAVLLLFLWRWEGDWLVVLLLGVAALDVMRLSIKNMLLGRRTYLPMITYLLVSASVVMPTWQIALASLLLARSNVLVSYGFRRSLSFDYVFRSGVLLSLSTLLAFESIFLLPSFVVGLWYSRRTWREIVVALVGYALPIFTLCYVNWGMNDLPFLGFFVEGLASVGWGSCQCSNIYSGGYFTLGYLILFGLILLLSLYYVVRNINLIRRRALRLTMFLVWQMISCLIIFAFSSSGAVYALMAVPLSILMCRVFVLARQWLAVTIYLIMMLAVFVGQAILG